MFMYTCWSNAGVRTLYNLLDVQRHVELPSVVENDVDLSADRVADTFIEGGVESLPDAIKPAAPAPPNTKVQMIIQHDGEGTYSVLKHYMFARGAKSGDALPLLVGTGATNLFREHQTWHVDKTLSS